ncbi:reverse transcriptase [Gossypium australe]|uniref:Reverse transcriptase n=1 Tax=Gossypium australe TaxID=47621 RepID=A0A5B6VVR9_9ROSI|nr:reverse transcriptase [Gossypium australe]
MAEFTADEIVSAVKSIAPLKASGIDGFPAIFLSEWKGRGGILSVARVTTKRSFESAKVEERLKGTKVGRGNVAVSHLFFADDCMLFGDASIEGASTMKAIIKEYELVSGQLVNFDKSLIYFNRNVDSDIQDQVGGILGVRVSNNPEKYLGLPTMIGRRKKHAFVDIKERFLKALQNWSLRLLSAGGKEVFLKSILQAIPIYAM